MKNLWTTIMVNNMDTSLEFYVGVLGLTIDRKYLAGPGVEIAFLGDGESKFELICSDALKEVNLSSHVSTGFQVDNVDETIEVLKQKGIEILEGPFEPSPAIKFFYIQDPNGYRIQLVQLNQ